MLLKVHFKKYQKSLSVFIVICFLTISLAVLTVPQKTEATCTNMSMGGTMNSNTVPVNQDNSMSYTTGQQHASTEYYKTCIMDGIATVIGKKIIQSLTSSITKWINSGFKGNPSFVQNPQNFFNDLADKVGGSVIENIAPELCSPFRLNIKLALSMSMSSNQQEEIGCTLTDVENNFKNFANDSGGNWDNWFQITQTPQNNPYGAGMLAQAQLSMNIETAQGKYQQQLDWGRGFLSSEDCPSSSAGNSGSQSSSVYDQNNPSQSKYGVYPGDNGCTIKTPGATIQDQLDTTLGSDLHGLEIAQSIDQIFSALAGQLMSKALGAGGGLVGASSNTSSSGSNNSYYQNNTNNIPTIPISGFCTPNTQNAQIGDIITWSASIPDINGNVSYTWYGDENLTGTDSSESIRYGSGGTKTASVIVRSVNDPTQSAQIDCTPDVTITNSSSTTAFQPTVSCTAGITSTPINTPVTWQAHVTGGVAPFTYSWQGNNDFTGTGQAAVMQYPTVGSVTATVTVTGADGNTASNNCDSAVNITR